LDPKQAAFGIAASALFFAASAAMLVLPQRINELKVLGVPTFLVGP
jgi:hypothetical protein